MSLAPADSEMAESTPPTSPSIHNDNKPTAAMEKEEAVMQKAREKEDLKRDRAMAAERAKDIKGGSGHMDQKFKALEYLLSQSKLYSAIMLDQMTKQEEAETAKDERSRKRADKREEVADRAAQRGQQKATRAKTGAVTKQEEEDVPTTEKTGRGRPKKEANKSRNGNIAQFMNKDQVAAKAGKASIAEALEEEAKEAEVKPTDIGMQDLRSAKQPELVTGGLMRTYQLEGLDWLTSLYENGLNGILADEMGLGKTLQTISFLAFLREKGINGPFLIVAPLSTTSNWVAEFKRWTPSVPAVLYHGSKDERAEIRNKRLRRPGSETFPVVCTSYEICMNDRKFLANMGWKYIIIDEGHRIKNLNCRLIRELQSYQSANRLLITGTPLQNNLTELWSLLHFLMPSIFDKLESFESWFDFSALKEKSGVEQILSEEKRTSLVTSLHAILKPFLLRRVKADVETSLPKKREYVLYAPLTTTQRELYQEILQGTSRAYLENKVVETLSRDGTATPSSTRSRSRGMKRKATDSADVITPAKSTKSSRASTPATANGNGTNTSTRSRRAKNNQNYEEISDTKWFKQVEEESATPDTAEASDDADEVDPSARTLAQTLSLAKKEIAQKKLQNPIMQLRLCCNSPHNFYWPFDYTDKPEEEIDYSAILRESGKMQLLDRLLPNLLAGSHKILIFSQFKSQLDILSTYCSDLRGWPISRIDGSIPQSERQEQILAFNDPASEMRIFLLSTRAGGQGINLAAADTVILFDSDWNPQQDLQAQDRAHRIGQTRPVIVYRLATRNTVEEVLLSKADSKRRLEKLVIQKGRFRQQGGNTGSAVDFEELQRLLGRDDGERIDVKQQGKELLSDAELKVLTDRSDEAFARAERGEDAAGKAFTSVVTNKDGGGLLESLQR